MRLQLEDLGLDDKSAEQDHWVLATRRREVMTMRNKNRKTVKNRAKYEHGFCSLETALITIGWIAFAIGIYANIDPQWKVILLAISRVLP